MMYIKADVKPNLCPSSYSLRTLFPNFSSPPAILPSPTAPPGIPEFPSVELVDSYKTALLNCYPLALFAIPIGHESKHTASTMAIHKPLTTLYKDVQGSKITTDIFLPPSGSATPQKYPVGEYHSAPIEYRVIQQS